MPSPPHSETATSTSGRPAAVPIADMRPAALAAELRVALMRSVRKIRQQRSSDVITDAQYSVLAWLDKRGPLTPRELADFDHVQPPSMTRTVNCLAQAGLVERAGHPDDGRQVLVSLTEAGAQEVKETRRRRDAWLARQLAELEPREREVLAEAAQILRRVIAS
ncbi:MAG: MarR family winged helix-turn-helix transcriptional regulator [Actinomycetes bacterium]